MSTQQIWETHHEDVFRFIKSKVKDKEVSSDLLQETFIKVHTKLDTLKDRSKLKSWIFSIARNTVYTYFKGQKPQSEIGEISQESNEDNWASHTQNDCLHGIIKRLPKKYRDPLFLADIEGVKQAEVANRLKLGLSATKSRIQRARKLIAKGYMDCCNFKMNEKGLLVGEMKEKEDCKICS